MAGPAHSPRPKGVPAWAWPEPTASRLEREQPAADPVDRSQFVIVATADLGYSRPASARVPTCARTIRSSLRSSAGTPVGWFLLAVGVSPLAAPEARRLRRGNSVGCPMARIRRGLKNAVRGEGGEPQPVVLPGGGPAGGRTCAALGESRLFLAPLLALIFTAAGCKRGRSQGELDCCLRPTPTLRPPFQSPPLRTPLLSAE
jgi:hypothetical protein